MRPPPPPDEPRSEGEFPPRPPWESRPGFDPHHGPPRGPRPDPRGFGHGHRTPPWGWEGPPPEGPFMHGGQWRDPRWRHAWRKRTWNRRARGVFWRLLGMFGLMTALLLGGMIGVGLLIYHGTGGNTHPAMVFWIGGCLCAPLLPTMAVGVAIRAFRDIAHPLGDVMNAADAIAEGDLTVRVPEARGQFRGLAYSFNRMISELERAEEQRRSLTADVAHELRTPLHILQGSIEGLIDGVYQPTPEHLNAMLDETRLLSRLVEDLRTLSLAESGHLALHRERIAAADLLSDVATSFSGPAEAAGVQLRIDAGSLDGAMVEADPVRINQVLGNLVANALRHTGEGGTVTLRGDVVPGGIRLSVADTGEGIAPDELPFIFDRFWKGDKARSREAGSGSGLGLAIARQLIHLHGGRIEAISTPGQGTTFEIELPTEKESGPLIV